MLIELWWGSDFCNYILLYYYIIFLHVVRIVHYILRTYIYIYLHVITIVTLCFFFNHHYQHKKTAVSYLFVAEAESRCQGSTGNFEGWNSMSHQQQGIQLQWLITHKWRFGHIQLPHFHAPRENKARHSFFFFFGRSALNQGVGWVVQWSLGKSRCLSTDFDGICEMFWLIQKGTEFSIISNYLAQSSINFVIWFRDGYL